MIVAAGLSDTVNNGPLIAASGIALLVGVVGFLSPCVLPLVPGYLAYVAGLNGTDERPSPRRAVGGALLFVLGFTAVFVAGGILFGSLGGYIREYTLTLERVFGVITIIMGLVFLGWIPFLQREVRIHARPKAGLAGAPLLGITFGLAWAPCLTPTLTVIASLAQEQANAGRGAFLSFVYCIGLGVPFVLVALGIGWFSRTLTFLRKHARLVSQLGGGLLIVFGFLLVTGAWDHWMAELRSWAGPTSGFGNNL
ncbi:MAG: Cytochrome c biosis protein [Pseudonocardiales bacterium]|nr:Cytochrome c biosis protein [Pseudonocardiales bacterium]